MTSATNGSTLPIDLTSLSISTPYTLEDLVPSEGIQTLELGDFCSLSNTRLGNTKLHSILCCTQDNSSGLSARSILIYALPLRQPPTWLRIERRLDKTPSPGRPEWLAEAPLDMVRFLTISRYIVAADMKRR